jgi:tetratricopeptide (TPR) repeat protein
VGFFLKILISKVIMKKNLFIFVIIFFLFISCNSKNKNEAIQLYNKGSELGQKGKLEESVEVFKKAIELYPDSPEAHNGLGFSHLIMKKYDEAEGEFQKAIKLKYDYFKPYNNLGDLYKQTDKLEKAVDVWIKYLTINPDIASLQAKVGSAKMSERSGKYYNPQEALKHFEKAIKLEPQNAGFRLLLANCYQNFKEYLAKSITEYNTIINTPDISPDIIKNAYSGMAYSYLALEKKEESTITIKQGLRLYLEDYVMNLYAGQIFAYSGDKKEAEIKFLKAIAIDPKDIRTYIHLPAFYVKENQLEKAIDLYKKGMENLPEQPILPVNLGLLYSQKLGDCEKAIKLFQKAIDLKIDVIFIPLGEIGKCLLRMSKTDEALSYLEKALKSALDLKARYAIECRYYIAEAQIKKGDKQKAKEQIDKILELDPKGTFAEKGKLLLAKEGN